MAAGYRGAFVISLVQSELDGVRGGGLRDLAVGSVWRWWGEATRVDGPADILLLDGAEAQEAIRRRAAGVVARLLGSAAARGARQRMWQPEERPAQSFTVTDGVATYVLAVLDARQEVPLVMVSGALPPRDTDLSVIECQTGSGPARDAVGSGTGVICFALGTQIATPDGLRCVGNIRAGDRITTRDDGDQDVLWTGRRRMSGARLHAMPALRPIRIRAGALGLDEPKGDLLVSPDHRILVTGARARDLFGDTEVLVAARDLVDDRHVVADATLREVTYVHLLTARHQVIWANGLVAETFHPASADVEALAPHEKAALLAQVEGLAEDPFRYGDYARRALSCAEAAILRHAAA